MKQEPLVYILILNYSSLVDTLECVKAVRVSDYKNFCILVIDNASPDGSGLELASQLPKDEFLQHNSNIGYAGGNNSGIQIAMEKGAQYVFILNPDVRISSTTISSCVSITESDPTIGAVNPIQLLGNTNTIDSKFRNTSLLPAGLKSPIYHVEAFPDAIEVRELLGAAFFLSVRAIKHVGGFDPLYFAYGEETDLCRRLRYHNFRLIVIGVSPVHHLRTKEAVGVSHHILFLRLKGIYLGQLKNPWRSFRRSLQLVTAQFFDELLGKRRELYPFKNYPVTRIHSILTFVWILINLVSIRRHRRLEQQGRAHI